MTVLAMALPALAQPTEMACGNPFTNGYGPYDYRVEQGARRKIVEDYHFTTRVESLISGISGPVGAELDYTLRAFPNHHRALVSMMNLGARTKSAMPRGAQFSVECYFRRALQFRPDDVIARMIFAKFLAANGRRPEAIAELEHTTKSAADSGFTQYNAGMVYFEMGEFDRALQQAHLALALGFDWQGLKQQLQSSRKWSDPASVAPEAPASAAQGPAAAPAGSAPPPAR